MAMHRYPFGFSPGAGQGVGTVADASGSRVTNSAAVTPRRKASGFNSCNSRRETVGRDG